MFNQLRSIRLLATAGLATVLAAPALVAAPAGAEPLTAASAMRSGVLVSAAPHVHDVTARAGRTGAHLGSIYVSAYLSTAKPAVAKNSRVYVQRLVQGKWRNVGSRVIADPNGPGMQLKWASSHAAVLRVVVPKLKLVTPRMRVPAAPSSTKSRYYVRDYKVGDGGTIFRVFKDGTTYSISHGDLEYSCWAGRVAANRLRLTTFDFGSATLVYRTSGNWRTLRIHDSQTTPVGGARTALTGKNKKYLGFCSSPAYAQVTTDPNGI